MTIIASSLGKPEDGTELVARNNLQQLSGVRKHLTRTEFNTAVAAERTRITNNSTGLYKSGEEFTIIGETGIRTWVIGTGGTDAVNAAASHAKNVTIRPGLSLLLIADANAVLSGTGVPGAGLGVNDDAYVDFAGNVYYTKSAGTWFSLGVIYIAGGGRIIDAVSRSITISDNGQALAPSAALTYTIPAGLSPMPSFTIDCPSSGVVTIAVSGGSTINGVTTTLTRSRTANPVGFVVLAHSESNFYGVSGA